jgi:hypothetical protein
MFMDQLRKLTITEISGAFGDMGTLLPILVSLTQGNQISITTSLIFGGIFNIIGGVWFQIPMCVQPMKSIGLFKKNTANSHFQLGPCNKEMLHDILCTLAGCAVTTTMLPFTNAI